MPGQFSIPKSRLTLLLALVSALAVVTCYVWFISYGSWNTWPGRTDDYDQLASAFQHGNLALEMQPDPALLALPNPYNPNKRAGINYPLDFSLYEGKYYLYFGPVPALFLLIFKELGAGPIGDEVLAFLFICGIFIAQALLILQLWNHFFRQIPAWLVPLCILFSGLISPWPWMLTEARVYEAAGAGAQFFFLAGLFFLLAALPGATASPTKLFLAGSAWALALGSRLTQALPVGFLSLLLAVFFIRDFDRNRSWANFLVPLASFGLPLAAGIFLVGGYNWARFGSVLESGFSYQLTLHYIQQYRDVLFSPRYLLPNTYDYLLMPPRVLSGFPFLQPIPGTGNMLFNWITLPDIYNVRPVTGLVFTTPFILFAGIPVMNLLLTKWSKPASDQFHWLTVGLAGAFLVGFAALAGFFWVATRYISDVTPPLILLAVAGFWQGYCALSGRPLLRGFYLAAGIGLMGLSLVVSTLVTFSARSEIYQAFNPVLWNQLVSLFP